jgi:hypothetical protein
MEAWRAGGLSKPDGKYQFGFHGEKIEAQSRRSVEVGRKLAAQEITFSVDRGRPSHGSPRRSEGHPKTRYFEMNTTYVFLLGSGLCVEIFFRRTLSRLLLDTAQAHTVFC